jgi:hypothetical protein
VAAVGAQSESREGIVGRGQRAAGGGKAGCGGKAAGAEVQAGGGPRAGDKVAPQWPASQHRIR